MNFAIGEPTLNNAALCEPVLRALPEWFGIESATQEYIRSTETLPTLIAYLDGQAAGFLSIKQHNPYSAEIYVIAVLPQYHRQGCGKALVLAAEHYLRDQNVEYLQVKTLGTAHPDPGYAKTRQFYLAMGFRPLEELADLWGSTPCLLMVKRL
jgi:GNAT superfamily N-acetyltransferase